MNELEKRRIFRLFALGKTPDQVAEILNRPAAGSADNQPDSIPVATAAHIDVPDIKNLFREYFAMPISEKYRHTGMPEHVTNRIHRLMDDIADLERVNAALKKARGKTIISLFKLKQEIKERMANEDASPLLRHATARQSANERAN